MNFEKHFFKINLSKYWTEKSFIINLTIKKNDICKYLSK